MKIRFNIHSLLILFLGLAMCLSCNASPKGKMKKVFLSQKANGYGKMLKDSIASIVIDAKSVSCELQSRSPEDTLRQDTLVNVPSRLHSVVQYLFFNENNFQTNDAVYGRFESWACYQFKVSRRKNVFLELDFGLRKWRLLDSNRKTVCTGDMKETNMQFLHFTRLLFPNDKTLDLLYKNFKAK